MTIALVNEKGGCGKSTLATNLARALQREDYEVLLVDTDEQGTSTSWAAASDRTPTTVSHFTPTLEKDLRKMKSFDFIIVDGKSKIKGAGSVIAAADLVLIPVQPSAADLWAASDTVELIKRRQELLGTPKAAFVISRQIHGTRLASEIGEVLALMGLPVLKGRTTQRIVYADAVGAGLSVFDLDDEKAKQEIRTITEEVLELCRDNR